ncbi:VOC family protein [Longispora sp. K20-0274]|uniref:VOC family protein n=1 Tax=Longispora sp. K20-0274 TaxID=3088255 RepID=UPI00399B72FA
MLVFWLGTAVAVGAVAYHGMSSFAPNRRRRMVEGSARVIAASPAPPGVTTARCELQLVVEAPGLPATAQTIRDPGVPVAKWPVVGQRLPVKVLRADPREVTIRWDRVRPASAGGDEEFMTRLTTRAETVRNGTARQDDELGSYLDELFSPVDAAPEPTPPPTPVAVAEPAPEAEPVREKEPEPPQQPQLTSLPAFVLPEFEPLDLPEFELADFVTPPPTLPTVPAQPTGPVEPAVDPGRVPLPRREPKPLDHARWGASLDEEPEPRASRLIDPSLLTGGRASYEADAELADEIPDEVVPASIQGVGVSLMVSDLPRSLEFYRDTLGFTELDSGGGAAILAAGDAKLLLRQLDDARPEGPRLAHVNLEVDDVDTVYQELRSKGVRFLQRPRAVASTALMELWSVSFKDPDGHGLALTSWRYR